MDRPEAVEPSAPEMWAARLALAEADPAAQERLQRIANLAALAFSVSRAAILLFGDLFGDGEARVGAKVAPVDIDWPAASDLKSRWRGLHEASISIDASGFHAAAPLVAADGPVLGVLVLEEPKPSSFPW
jgi:hypothetical protein